MKQWILLVVCLIGVSCNKETRLKNCLQLNITQDPPTLDPRVGGDDHSNLVLNFLFDPLMRIGKDGKAVFCVADRVDISADQRVYTFHLRDSKWSNGAFVEAYDFEYAWKSLLDPNFHSQFVYELYLIKNAKLANQGSVSIDEVGIKALNAHTLRVELEHPAPYFLELLAKPSFFPVYKQDASTNPQWALQCKQEYVCNGAFTLESWAHHDQIRLKKNPLYWQQDEVFFSNVQISMVTSEDAQMKLFDEKQLDWVGRPMSSLPIPMLQQRKAQIESLPVAAVSWGEINTRKKPLDNVHLRRALSIAVNRKQIIHHVLAGQEEPAFSVVPPTIWSEQPPLFDDGNIQEAKRLFDLAIQEVGSIDELTVIFATSPNVKKIAQILQDTWQTIFPIKINLVTMEWKTFFDRRESLDFDICLISYTSDFNDAISMLELFKEAANSLNVTQWENVDFTKLLNLSSYATTFRFREKLLQLASKKLTEEMPVIPLFYDRDYFIRHDYVTNVEISKTGVVDFRKGRFK